MKITKTKISADDTIRINPEGCLVSDETVRDVLVCLNKQQNDPEADRLSEHEKDLYLTCIIHLTFRLQLYRTEERSSR